jgi:hypothetical protein
LAIASDNNDTAACQVVLEALEELYGSFQQVHAMGDTALLRDRLGFWKGRTVQALEENVAGNIAEAFGQISLSPSWVQSETWEDVINHHRSFLVALHENLTNDPEALRQVQRSAPNRPHPRRPALKPPDKVTLSWLFHHLPLGGWVTLLGLIAAAFLLGFRLGQHPETARIVNGLFSR